MKEIITQILNQTALTKTGLARLIEVAPAMLNAVMNKKATDQQADYVRKQLLSFSKEILRTYNDWRRGADIEAPGPVIVGVAIDVAVWLM